MVLVISSIHSEKKCVVHCLRTILESEFLITVKENLIRKIESIRSRNSSDTRLLNISKVRWYYKDVRTAPIEFGDPGSEIIGEHALDFYANYSLPEKATETVSDDTNMEDRGSTLLSSNSISISPAKAVESSDSQMEDSISRSGFEDGEFEISFSDLAYLTKAERKGYLLKRSSWDVNLWRRYPSIPPPLAFLPCPPNALSIAVGSAS